MKRLVISALLISSAFAADLIIKLPDGRIRGSEISHDNKTYYAYRGIPFATPPLGKLRFQAPVPPQPWYGILETIEPKPCCISMGDVLGGLEQSEDCLYLNVYTPARKIKKKLPVMLYIYGGGFSAGCASEAILGPFYLLDEDIVVVFFNYRVGIYGFLSTQDNAILGNAGLKDQLLAMKWIKNNVALFGGDPEKITIFGESAGGISVGAHILNKKSAGLYRAAICQSGCSLTNISLVSQSDPRKAAYDYAKYIDPTISEKNTTTEIRDFLQSQPVEVLTPSFNANTATGIAIEIDDEDAYVTNFSYPLLESGNFNQVPLMLGTSASESLLFLTVSGGLDTIAALAAMFDADVSTLIPSDLVLLPGTNATEVGNIIKEAYVGENGTFSENFAAVVELTSDVLFPKSTLKQAELQSNFTPVYLYQFSLPGLTSLIYPTIEGVIKASHGDDGPYTLNTIIPFISDRAVLLHKQMVRLWSNFAKTMNPTPDASDPLLNITWTQVSPTNIQYLDLNDPLELKPNRKAKEMDMWNHVYYTYGQQPFAGF